MAKYKCRICNWESDSPKTKCGNGHTGTMQFVPPDPPQAAQRMESPKKFSSFPWLEQWKKESSLEHSTKSGPNLEKIDNIVLRYHGASDLGKISILGELIEAISKWKDTENKKLSLPASMEALNDLAETTLEDLQGIPSKKKWDDATRGLLKLDKVNELLNLYRQAYTPQAQKNLAADLSAELTCWISVKGNMANPVINKLKQTMDKKAGGIGYTQVACIAYVVLTNDYSTANPNDNLDMLDRWTKMAKAVEAAYNGLNVGIRSNPKTLKIFMAPEFYFRGRNAAYGHHLFNAPSSSSVPKTGPDLLEKIRSVSHDKKYNDWLFVFGTAVLASVTTLSYCTRCKNWAAVTLQPNKISYQCTKCKALLAKKDVIWQDEYNEPENYALICKGDQEYFILKEFVSDKDYKGGKITVELGNDLTGKGGKGPVSTKTLPFLPVGGSSQRKDFNLPDPSKFTDERMGGSMFTVDGIKFGLEVCLDHGQKRLAGAEGIKVHLIPSCGMDIGSDLFCVNKGIVFNVDGSKMNKPSGHAEVKIKGSSVITEPATNLIFPGPGELKAFGPFSLP
jgi:hypothetical protein